MKAEDMNQAQDDLSLMQGAIWEANDGTGEVLMVGVAKTRGESNAVFRPMASVQLQALPLSEFVRGYQFVESLAARESRIIAKQYEELARLTSGMAGAENYTEGFVVGMVDDQGKVVGPYYAREIVDWENRPRYWSLDIDEAVVFDTEAQAQKLLTEMSRKIDHQSNLAVKHVYRFNPLSWGTPSEVKFEPSLMPQQVQQIPAPQAANSDERQQQILVLMEEIFRDNQLTMDRTLALLGEIEGAAVAMRATLTGP